MKTMEERIEQAIIDRFFEASWMIQTQQILNPQTGQYHIESTPTQIPAPMTVVAQAIYNQAKAEIVRKVMEKLDIDAIVAEWAPSIAKDVVARLNEKPNSWSAYPSKSEREKMLSKVYDAVAEEFGRQCVEHLKNTGGLLAVLEAAPLTSE